MLQSKFELNDTLKEPKKAMFIGSKVLLHSTTHIIVTD